MTKPTLAVVGTVGLPANYGGFETMVQNILPDLVAVYDVTVYCAAGQYPERPAAWGGATLDYVSFNANGVQSIPYDIVSMWRARRCDAVLILGVSGCAALPLFRLLSRARLVVNVDGLEWKRDKWSWAAKAFLRLSERLAASAAHVLVADNKVIQDHLRDAYGKQAALIAYGGDWQGAEGEVEEGRGGASSGEAPPEGGYAFGVCRIEPENNVHLVLEAFAALDYPLIMVGNWTISKYARDLFERYHGKGKIRLEMPIYDRAALDRYRAHCRLYVHGHSAGGTNPSLVEAMWLGLTVACFDVDFNRESTENAAVYFADAASLRDIVGRVAEEGYANGAAMKQIADRRYTWAAVAKAYIDILT